MENLKEIYRVGKMVRQVKILVAQALQSKLNSKSPNKKKNPDLVTCVWNPSIPEVRWKAKMGESPKSLQAS